MIYSIFQFFKPYLKRDALALLLLGFSAGLPLALVLSTLGAWLKDLSIAISTITAFQYVRTTYSFKVCWSPWIDSLPVFFSKICLLNRLDKRRAWMLIGQLGIIIGLITMALVGSLIEGQPSPVTQAESVEKTSLLLWGLALAATIVAFFSTIQDIAIDAYRIELASTERQGLLSSTYVLGYRLAMLLAGGGALILADHLAWPIVYGIMAVVALSGVASTLWIAPQTHQSSQEESSSQTKSNLSFTVNIKERIINPFIDFFKRNGSWGIGILSLICVYNLSDIIVGPLTTPFYLHQGYSKTEIGSIVKLFGFIMTIAGASICGPFVAKVGLFIPLLAGVLLTSLTNVLLYFLAKLPQPEIGYLTFVISADNFGAGFASTAFIAYLSSLTSKAYTATQYALFSSLMILPGTLLSASSGKIVENIGYAPFFLYSSLAGIPAILLIIISLRGKTNPATKKSCNY